jgi:hypothetical protein
MLTLSGLYYWQALELRNWNDDDDDDGNNNNNNNNLMAMRAKSVCNRLIFGIVGSNLAGAMDISLLRVLCEVR